MYYICTLLQYEYMYIVHCTQYIYMESCTKLAERGLFLQNSNICLKEANKIWYLRS